MPGFTVSAQIDRPVEQVWARLTDWSLAPRWMKGLDWMRLEGPLVVGSALRFSTRGREGSSQITALDPPHELAVRTERRGVRAEYRYRLSPEGAGTRATLDAQIEGSGFFSRRICAVVTPLVKRADGGQMAALKTLVEG